MKLYIKNKLFLTGYEEIEQSIIKQIKSDLTFVNPKWQSLEKMGKYNRHIPKYIEIFKYQDNGKNKWLELPRGYLKKLDKHLLYQAERIDRTLVLPDIDIQSKIKLRDYQIEPVNKISCITQGGLIAVCGSGKTNMAIELMCRVKQTTLWICHTKELLNQTISRMIATTTLTKEEIGIISEGKVKIGSKVTIGLIGTLCKRDMKDIQDKFGCIILDEAHHLPANTFYDVITQFDARYRYYVTATPEREDGLTNILTYEMGEAVANITLDDIKDNIVIPKLQLVKTNFVSTAETYHELMEEICKDQDRNISIADKIKSEYAAGKHIIILSDRVEHCETLKSMCNIADSVILTGTTKKKDREQIMIDMNNKKYRVLFATKLAREGLDITHLDTLILATPKRAKGAVTQEVGRIMRSCEGKTEAKVIDFIDDKMGIFKGQYYKRREAYKDMKMI